MKSKSKLLKVAYAIILLCFLIYSKQLFGFEVITHDEGFFPGSHRLEMRDLGFEHTDLIPADESAITSLVEAPNGDIYGGTTGRVCHLFVFSPFHEKARYLLNRVRHLGTIPGHESIHHSLVADSDGIIYIGTGLNEFEQHPISDPPSGHAGITIGLWADIKKVYSQYEGGHLYKFNINKDERRWVESDEECLIEDLGIPIPHNGIYALTINTERSEIYGITYPDGHFFVYDIKAAKFTDLSEIYEQKIYTGPDNRTLRSITRALVCDEKGFVYGSADEQKLFRYNPETKKIEKLDVKIPHLYYSVVEAFTKDNEGIIYGGTLEGYLFRLDTEGVTVTNLGKPFAQLRIRGLTIANNGLIYGIAGQRSNHCRLFSYNIAKSEFKDLGILQVVREPYYQWTALQMDAILTGKDGTIYIGESERRSHLFLYYP
jgi:hypothetical protein